MQALLDTALDPVLDKTEAEAADPAQALLKVSIIDPACGSGHFLLAAARRIATRLARIRTEGIAVSNHRGNGRLIENLSAGTWAPGPGLDAFDTAGWPDGRAGFVLEALSALDLDTTVTSMPDEVRGWIAHATTA